MSRMQQQLPESRNDSEVIPILIDINVWSPRVGVTKALFVIFSVSNIFDLEKVIDRFFGSHSYLTGVIAA